MSSLLSFATGVSVGANYSYISGKQAELNKGTSDYPSSLCQAAQFTNAATLGSKITTVIPNPNLRMSCKAAMTAVSLAGWVVCPVSAAVKQGHFESGVKFLKSFERLKRYKIDYLPDKLNERQEKIFRYVAEHFGVVSDRLMVAGTLILPFIGYPYMALGLIAPIGYQMADSRGWVSRKTSLFIETYFPSLVSIGTLVGGGPLAKTIVTLNFLTYFPSFNRIMHQKVDKLTKNLFDLAGPSIEEIDAPVVVDKNLSFDQINQILNANADKFTVNPAHCSKANWALRVIPKDFNFSKLLDLFIKIDWEKYPGLSQSFLDDDRFIDFLKGQFLGKDDILKRFDYYLDLLAQKQKITKERLLANTLKTQMQELVKMLKGERRPEGSQKHADEAIHYCAQILSYLLKLDLSRPQDKVVFEDIIKKLALEGGEYCARGVKRAAKEIVNGILQESEKTALDPIEDYERQLYQGLEIARSQLMTAYYKKFIDLAVMGMQLITNLKDASTVNINGTDPTAGKIAEDVHVLDLYRLVFSLGVVPLSDYERDSMGFNELNCWSNPRYPFREFRLEIYEKYSNQIDDVIKELGHIHFSTYMRSVLNQNRQLKSDEVNEVIETFTECNEGAWSTESTQRRFNRLACVMLGILKYNSIQDEEWIEVNFPKIEADSPKINQSNDEDWEVVDLGK